jgi:hypothetical protein
MRHITLANGHSKKRCCMDSLLSQKQQFSLPVHYLLIRLSFVEITFHCRNHIKIFIFSGTFIFQIYFFKYFVSSSSRSMYMDFTVNALEGVKSHTKTSLSSFSWTDISRCTSCNHNLQRFSVKERQKVIFNMFWFSTLATETCLHCTMLYREGYCSAKDLLPSQVSSQNLVSLPLPIVKEPLLRKSYFTALLKWRISRLRGYLGQRFRMKVFVSQ